MCAQSLARGAAKQRSPRDWQATPRNGPRAYLPLAKRTAQASKLLISMVAQGRIELPTP